jgi:hypothetical protein
MLEDIGKSFANVTTLYFCVVEAADTWHCAPYSPLLRLEDIKLQTIPKAHFVEKKVPGSSAYRT